MLQREHHWPRNPTCGPEYVIRLKGTKIYKPFPFRIIDRHLSAFAICIAYSSKSSFSTSISEKDSFGYKVKKFNNLFEEMGTRNGDLLIRIWRLEKIDGYKTSAVPSFKQTNQFVLDIVFKKENLIMLQRCNYLVENKPPDSVSCYYYSRLLLQPLF